MISTYLTVVTGKSITTAKDMSDITVINDSEQSSLVTNGLAKNGELYLKASGSTDAGAIVAYDSGSWRTFANEAVSFQNQYSVDFDGTNDYLDTGSSFSSTFQSDYTISSWFKRNETATTGKWLYGHDYRVNGKHILKVYYTTTDIFFNFFIGSAAATAYASYTPDTNWHHLVVSASQSGGSVVLKTYLDGIYKNTTSFTASISNYVNPENLAIGSGFGPTAFAYSNAKQDEFAIFGSALSDGSVSTGQTAGGDIATLYNSGVPADISSLSPVAWYRMGDNDGGTGTTITDQGSGGNDGTLTNGPTFSSDVPS